MATIAPVGWVRGRRGAEVHGSAAIRIRDHSGSAATLLVVQADLIGLGRSLDRGEATVDRILLALQSSSDASATPTDSGQG